MLAEIEDVGGPEEKIDRLGVLKSVGACEDEEDTVRSISEYERGFSLDDVLRGSSDDGLIAWDEDDLDELEGNHDGT